MSNQLLNKRKIINDPVYGFIKIPYDIIYSLIEHPYFQRLRRINQLGTTSLVYPGANHTRFQHALGAMHLMGNAIATIRSKGHEINQTEEEAVTIAILLHDIGHGPFSHTLEQSIIKGVQHETISHLMMEKLNDEFNGKLSLAIQIFRNEYPKKFLHQLVSGQLDMDRLDYLRRDSFFTGVTEGTIGSDRIIKMLDVHNDQLVVEEKGIYSIEKFLVARRLMYWQVYLHKGVIAADQVLIKMLSRARHLFSEKISVPASPQLAYFLGIESIDSSQNNGDVFLEQFANLDDNDIVCAAKSWCHSDDPALKYLSEGFVNRKLFRIEINDKAFPSGHVENIKRIISKEFGFPPEQSNYLIASNVISNHAYSNLDENITILTKDGKTKDISELSEILDFSVLSKKRSKYYLCYPKNIQALQ